MCGIGLVWKKSASVTEDQIRCLTNAVAHRGPDGEGLWFNKEKNLALGHRRLAILDLSHAGDQPMASPNGRYRMIYNGEIYNFLELKKALLSVGYQFYGTSDTEVLIAAYQEWGEAMLPRLNGMWAIAIYDEKDHSIFLARDRYGVKPIYYHATNELFLCSSETQAIHKYLGASAPLNRNVINNILQGLWSRHGTADTFLQGVFSLPAGSVLKFQNQNIELRKWYELPKIVVPSKFSDQTDKLKDLIFDACKLRLRSDVAVATCLSGGVDSGSISSVVANIISSQNPKDKSEQTDFSAFCAAFPGSFNDELADAKRIAADKKFAFESLNIVAPENDEIENAMQFCDGPMSTLGFYPIFQLYRFIRDRGIKVTLDGQGPDEMLGGYRPVGEGLAQARFEKKPLWYFDIYRTYAAQGEYPEVSSQAIAKNALKADMKSWFKPQVERSLEASLQQQFFKAPLPGILMQYDRASMASGVECRMPFMDYRIVEFIFSLPTESKVGGGFTKRILRESMRGITPDFVLDNKKKIGFNAPLVDWFRGPMRNWMLAQYSRPEFLQNEYFDGPKFKSEFESFLKTDKPSWDAAWRFWPPAHFVWWQNHVKTSKSYIGHS